MNILFTFDESFSLTGVPTYYFYLVKGLIELGNKISIVSSHDTNSFYFKEYEKLGVKLYDRWDKSYINDKFDLGVISHKNNAYILDEVNCLFINIVHSKYECERPIKHEKIIGRLACRPDVIDSWKSYKFYGFLQNPIDLQKFKTIENHTNTILSLSTIDNIRIPMILNLIYRAYEDNKKLIICGKDKIGFKESFPFMFSNSINFVEFKDETDKPEEIIAECDEIASLFEGRVALEGLAMGKKVSVYNENGEYRMLENVDMRIYDYKFVAENLLIYFEDMKRVNKVEIVVVRYNNKEIEDKCIETIKENTIWPNEIIEVDNYPQNEGLSTIWNRYLESKIKDNEFVCFINSDAYVTKGWLENMMFSLLKERNIEVGAVGCIGDNVFGLQGHKRETDKQKLDIETDFLSGYCLLTKKTDIRFPEEIPFYFNDRAYSDLMLQGGYNLLICCNAYVYHLDQKSQDEITHSKLGKDGEENYRIFQENNINKKLSNNMVEYYYS